MPRGETTTINGSIPSRNKKRRIDLKEQRDKQTDIGLHTDRHTDGRTDRVNDKKIIDIDS